jgi:hypothetical protein
MPELAKKYPLHKEGQIILDKDLEPYLVNNHKAGGLSSETLTTDQITSDKDKKPEPGPWTEYQAKNSEPQESTPATLPADFFSKPPGVLFRLTMPDGHVRYFADERDANNCQQEFFAWGKTQEMWNEAWVAGLDLSEVDLLKLPGDPPEPPWGRDAVRGIVDLSFWVCLCLGVFLFALGLGLILGIRAKSLPT